MKDDKLWRVFALFIKLREADSSGMVTCFTSGRRMHYTEADAGHFISRRHLSTKFDEQNVQPQSKHDNRFQYGRQFEFGKALDKKYGEGTADKLLVKSRQVCKWGKFEIDELTKYYKKECERLKLEKGL